MPNGVTAYNQMARALREDILAGRWATGGSLPTERALCGRFRVSRITVRRALEILEEENLLQRCQGRGTFVNVRPARKIPIVNGNFSASVQRHAPELQRALLDLRRRPATGDWARRLATAEGARVLFARRLDSLQGCPVALDDVVLRAEFASRLGRDDFAVISFMEHWAERQGLALEYESQAIEAVPAPAPVARLLRTRAGAPMLKETNVAYARGGRPAGLFTSFYRHEYVQFHSTAPLGGKPAPAARLSLSQKRSKPQQEDRP